MPWDVVLLEPVATWFLDMASISELPGEEGEGGTVAVAEARAWTDVKAEAHRRNPELADPDRQANARTQLDAQVAGHHLKELRKSLGKTQADVAGILGVSQARVSQIENGDPAAMELETLRGYATALGGHVDVTVTIGAHSVRVA